MRDMHKSLSEWLRSVATLRDEQFLFKIDGHASTMRSTKTEGSRAGFGWTSGTLLAACLAMLGLSACGKSDTPSKRQSSTPTSSVPAAPSMALLRCRGAEVPNLPRGLSPRRLASGQMMHIKITKLDVDVDVRIGRGRTSSDIKTPGLRSKEGPVARLEAGMDSKFVTAGLRVRNRGRAAIKPSALVVPFIAIRRAGARQLYGRVRGCPAAAYEAGNRNLQPPQVPIAPGKQARILAAWIVPANLYSLEAYVTTKRLVVPLR